MVIMRSYKRQGKVACLIIMSMIVLQCCTSYVDGIKYFRMDGIKYLPVTKGTWDHNLRYKKFLFMRAQNDINDTRLGYQVMKEGDWVATTSGIFKRIDSEFFRHNFLKYLCLELQKHDITLAGNDTIAMIGNYIGASWAGRTVHIGLIFVHSRPDLLIRYKVDRLYQQSFRSNFTFTFINWKDYYADQVEDLRDFYIPPEKLSKRERELMDIDHSFEEFVDRRYNLIKRLLLSKNVYETSLILNNHGLSFPSDRYDGGYAREFLRIYYINKSKVCKEQSIEFGYPYAFWFL